MTGGTLIEIVYHCLLVKRRRPANLALMGR